MMLLNQLSFFCHSDVAQHRRPDLRMMKIHREHRARSILRPHPRTRRKKVHHQHFPAPDIVQQRTAFEQAFIHRRSFRAAFPRELHRRLRDIERMALIGAMHAIEQRQRFLRQNVLNIGPIFRRDLRRDGPYELPDAPDCTRHPR